ncbi:serine/threonine-protein kinase prpf4B-like [Agrilus planipennis]|uniref:Serine/threonine-protein kinase prpf4B-like n=1 Tax=Agrilus planipennis TaxID=224129 RepID=A0A1W4W6T9_AGRPL|nr:serine/threonine-protein kinase prpf4B-like [Agrilus planipennis]
MSVCDFSYLITREIFRIWTNELIQKNSIICVLGTIVAHVGAGHGDITPSLVPAPILHSVPLAISPSIHLTPHDDLVALPLTFDWNKWKHKDESEHYWDRDGVRDGDTDRHRDRDRDGDSDRDRDKDKDRDWSWIGNSDWKWKGDKVGDRDRDRDNDGDRDKYKDKDLSWMGNRDWDSGGDKDRNRDRDEDRNKDTVRVWNWGDDKGHRDRDKGHKKFNLFKKLFKC